MNIKISKTSKINSDLPIIYIAKSEEDLNPKLFTKSQFDYIKTRFESKKKTVILNSYPKWTYIQKVDIDKEEHVIKEKLRRAAGSLYSTLKENKHKEVTIVDLCNNPEYSLAFTEGLALSHYQFLKYYSDQKEKEKKNHLKEIYIHSPLVVDEQIKELNILVESVYYTKDLANEPV